MWPHRVTSELEEILETTDLWIANQGPERAWGLSKTHSSLSCLARLCLAPKPNTETLVHESKDQLQSGDTPSEQISTTSPVGHRMDTGDAHDLLIYLPVVLSQVRFSTCG